MDGHPVQGGISFTTVPLRVFVPFVAKKISRTFPGLRWIFSGLQISLLTKVLKSILFTVDTHFLKHKFGILYCLKQADFQDFPGPAVFFPGLKIKFQDFPGFFQDPREPYFYLRLLVSPTCGPRGTEVWCFLEWSSRVAHDVFALVGAKQTSR